MADRVDPRFDPRYQRGYTPADAEDRVEAPWQRDARSRGRDDSAQTLAPAPLIAPPPPPGAPTPMSPTSGAPTSSAPTDVTAGVDADPARDAAEWRRPGRNPFLLALLVAAIALIAVAAWVTWWAATAPDSYTYSQDAGPVDVILTEVRYNAGPVLWTVGGIALVGWLSISALAAIRSASVR